MAGLLRSKYVLHPTICNAKCDPLVKGVSVRFCLCKGNFSYLKLKSNLLTDTSKLCECSACPAFHPTILTSICEPYLNQLLHWWLQNAIVFLISSFLLFLFYISLKNFSSCWLLEYWYGFMGYFLIQCAIIHYCHCSFLCSNYSKLAISFKLSSVFFWHVFTSLARHPCFLAQQIWDNWENLNIANILDITVLNSWEWSWHCGSCT